MKIEYSPEFDKSMKKLFSNNLYYLIPRVLKDIRYEIKWAWQRVFRGYDDRFCFDFNSMFPSLIIGVCDSMIKYGIGHPARLNSLKEWHSILEDIKKGFVEYNKLNDGLLNIEQQKQIDKEVDKSFKLLSKWYGNMWD